MGLSIKTRIFIKNQTLPSILRKETLFHYLMTKGAIVILNLHNRVLMGHIIKTKGKVMELSKKEFYARKHVLTMMIVAIIAFITMIILNYLKYAPLSLEIVVMFLLIVITVIRYNSIYVTVGDDYLSIKPAPVRARIHIAFNEITSIIKEEKRLVVFYKPANIVAQKIVIQISAMEDKDKQGLLEALAPKCT